MNTYLSAAILIVAAIVQASGLPHLTGTGVNADLVLLLIVAWGIIRGVQEGLLWGLIGGLVIDLTSAVPFGTTTFAFATVGWLSGLAGVRLLGGTILGPSLAAAIATVAYNGLLMVILALFGQDWQWLDIFGDVIVPATLLNAAVVVPIYWLLFQINRRLEPAPKW